MKKSGKLVLWITSACLIASLGACQNSDNTDANTDTISITETSAQASDETQASDTAQEYEKGSWDGNIYTNTGMDLTFTLPDGWMSASDENIAQTVGGNESIGGSDTDSSSPYDFMIVNASTNDNILLLAEDVSTAMGGSGMTAENYLESIESNLVSDTQTSYTFGEITDAVIAADSYKKLEVSVYYNGTSFTQAYYCRREGDQMLTFIATTATGDLSGCDQVFGTMTSVSGAQAPAASVPETESSETFESETENPYDTGTPSLYP
ncbi:MAG TPA: hypothetical protein IAB53_06790 [Candidatus Scybalocola faecipullorum]|nr:hypothetical protein [Candidatus Scybalocola faecipullorum]